MSRPALPLLAALAAVLAVALTQQTSTAVFTASTSSTMTISSGTWATAPEIEVVRLLAPSDRARLNGNTDLTIHVELQPGATLTEAGVEYRAARSNQWRVACAMTPVTARTCSWQLGGNVPRGDYELRAFAATATTRVESDAVTVTVNSSGAAN